MPHPYPTRRASEPRRGFMSLLAALSVSGAVASVYGIAQHAGIDPLRFDRFEVNSGRAPLTFGNPAFAGSFLTMSLFATAGLFILNRRRAVRSEEHTSELQSLMRISYAVFCL